MDTNSLIIIIIELIGAALAVASVVIVIINSHVRKMRFLIALGFCNLIYSFTHAYELISHSTDTAVILYKFTLWVVPLIAIIEFFFALEYSEKKLPPRRIIAVFFIISFGFSFCAQFYPETTLIHENIMLIQEPGKLTYAHSEPGILFKVGMVMLEVLSLAASIMLVRKVRKTRKTVNVFFVSIGMVIGIATQSAILLGFISGWDPLPSIHSIIMFIWCLNTVRFRAHEWVAFSRDSAIQKMSDGYLLIGSDGNLIDINSGAYDFFPQLHKAKIGDNLYKLNLIPSEIFDRETQMIQYFSQSGDTYYYTINRTPVTTKGRELATSILLINSTDNYRLIDHLKELSRRDPLTRLYNRAAFFNDVAGGTGTVLRRGADGAAMMLDIDFFKTVNDNHGHTAGDQVLVGIADILRSRLRGGDIVARYGGEEFCVWLPNTNLQGAMFVAENIRKSVEEHSFVLSHELLVNVTISIGVALTLPDHTETLEELLSRADDNLYRAKNSGRNKVVGPDN